MVSRANIRFRQLAIFRTLVGLSPTIGNDEVKQTARRMRMGRYALTLLSVLSLDLIFVAPATRVPAAASTAALAGVVRS